MKIVTGGGAGLGRELAKGFARAGAHGLPLSPRAEWNAVLDLNLRAPMLLTQLCLEPMRRAGGGVVINIASSGGIGYAAYGSPEYGATKAGLIPPEDVVDSVLDLVRDDTRSSSVVQLWGCERPPARLVSPGLTAASLVYIE